MQCSFASWDMSWQLLCCSNLTICLLWHAQLKEKYARLRAGEEKPEF